MTDPDRFARSIAAIDAANAADLHTLHVRGRERPKEQAHAELASAWIERLVPEAGEALRLAARAHHVERWVIPRDAYPAGRSGYHRWRKALQRHHARVVGRILEREGYDPQTIARVQALVRKQGLGRDPDVQALEDALCLVFLETQLGATAAKLGDEARALDVLRKTLRKMSPEARQLARAELHLEPAERAMLEAALQAEGG